MSAEVENEQEDSLNNTHGLECDDAGPPTCGAPVHPGLASDSEEDDLDDEQASDTDSSAQQGGRGRSRKSGESSKSTRGTVEKEQLLEAGSNKTLYVCTALW